MTARTDVRTTRGIPLGIVVPALASVILFTVAVFAFVIPYFESAILSSKRETIRELTEAVWTTLQVNHEEELAGRLTRAQAQERAINRIKNLRYGREGKDYFWINDMHPRMVLHPHRPEMNGQDLTDYADSKNRRLFVEAVHTVERQGAGYIEYLWQWKDDPERIVPKLSYVKGFGPWGWIIGTGVYLEDVRAQTMSMISRLIVICLVVLVITGVLSGWIIVQGTRAERRRLAAEEAQRQLTDQLHQAQKMDAVGQLASGVAHDFNNLLTAILSSVSLLRNAMPQDAKVLETHEAVERAVSHATNLTRSLLTFSRGTQAAKKPVMLNQLVESTEQLLRGLLPPSVRPAIDLPSDKQLWIEANETQIQQVILNLAINARDAMPEGGSLRISLTDATDTVAQMPEIATRPHAPYAALTISDTGTGIPEDVLPRLFEPFFTTKPREKATGLGLSVVHGIVEGHHGRIMVDSRAEQGTTFTIYLPCVAAAAPSKSDKEQAGDIPRGDGQTVLIAAANQFLRTSMASVLRLLDYNVLQAPSGQSVLQQVEEGPGRMQLIVLADDLADKSARACLEELRQADVHTPALLVSEGDATDLKSLDEHTQLLRKPFQMSEFGLAVGRIMSREAKPEVSS